MSVHYTKVACVFFLLFAIASGISYPETRESGWVTLFNGNNLDGWHQLNGSAQYTVEDGAIVGTTVEGSPNSFLCTEKLYRDFELEFEVRLDPRLNSGVQIRSNSFPEYREGRVHGYQVEIAANGDAGFIYDEARRGWLSSDRSEPLARKAFKKDEWNKFRVVCISDSIRTWVNGVPVAELVDSLALKGFIALQVHSFRGDRPAQVRWRNLRIRELNDYGWLPLFNGKNLQEWYTFLSRVTPSREPIGKNIDPGGIFQVHNGMIHVYKDAVAGEAAPFGYIASQDEYSHYQLRFQYRWGTKKFAPRQEAKRDAGLLYHVVGADQVWPMSVECQVQEGDTGDIFTVYTTVTTTVDPQTKDSQARFMDTFVGGVSRTQGGSRITRVIKSAEHEVDGWNTVEVIIRDDKAVHIVNGEINNRAAEMRRPHPNNPDELVPLTKGRIALQAEGAEIFYRKIEMRRLPLAPPD